MTAKKRYPELDWLRGIAVIAMMGYHLCFDLSLYYGVPIDVESGLLKVIARLTASVFLMLIGICFIISWERTAPDQRLWKYGKRSLMILAGGMIVTLVTWLIDPETYVIFGILHLIGVATVIQLFVRPLKQWNVLLGMIVLLIGFVLPNGGVSTALLLPFGIMSRGFVSVDYYPLLPWLGPILIGMSLGDAFYIPERRSFLSVLENIRRPRWLLWIGRKSLPLYFIHQPIILLLLWILLGR